MTKAAIGILAGMGPRSTAPFLNLVLDACQDIYGATHDIDFPKILICSQPAPFYEDRDIDHEAMERASLEGLKMLEAAGADFLAIACNTVHVYYESLAAKTSVPLLNIVHLTVSELPQSPQKVALIAARPTVESRIYQNTLTSAGHEIKDFNWQNQVDALLASVKHSKYRDSSKQKLKTLLKEAELVGVETVIVACLDLSESCNAVETPLNVVDSARCLARSVVEKWLQYNPAAH